MHLANSSTSSSEVPGNPNVPTPSLASVRSAFIFTILWLLVFEAGAYALSQVDRVQQNPVVRPLMLYFQRGKSIERQFRLAAESGNSSEQALIDAGWIDPSKWKDFPSHLEPGATHLVAFYGNSFTRQIRNQVARIDPGLTTRMIFGPIAPPSHAFASFVADRHEHEADVVVLGVVIETMPGLLGMTRSTQSVVEPFAYTFPRFRLVDGRLESTEPVISRSEDLRQALHNPEAWAAHVGQLERHDEYYSSITYQENLFDKLALTRMTKSAWSIRRHRLTSSRVLDSLHEPSTSESVALLLELMDGFARIARADGRRPLVLLIDTPQASNRASAYIRHELEARRTETILAGDSCPGDDPANFAGDGHLSEPCAARIAERVHDWIVQR